MTDQTIGMFAGTDKSFAACCERANVQATTRQASKFRRGKGAAYKRAIFGMNPRQCPVPFHARIEKGRD